MAEWLDGRTSEQENGFENWLRMSRGERIAVIEMGAGKAIPTVRRKGEWIAGHFGATLIRINPYDSEGPTGTISLPRGSLYALERIASSVAF